MPKIQVNDINMYYEQYGQGEPLVLIGGFSTDHTMWTPIVEILQQFYQVTVFDNRGAGQTDAPASKYSILQMANDTAVLCEVLNIKQAHFIGNSMGGFILQELARQNPQLIKTAIISNSTLTLEAVFNIYVGAQFELLKANAPLRSLIHASCCWAFSYDFLVKRNMLDILIEEGLNNPYPFTLTGYEGQYAAVNGFDAREWAKNIRVPTLVIGGDQDLIFSEPSIKLLADTIPNSSYYCFSTCGHLPMVEYPEQFSQLVRNFTSKH